MSEECSTLLLRPTPLQSLVRVVPRRASVAFALVATGDDLRGLMRLWPHGVSILSVDVEGDRMGVTVSSLVSLSLEPALVGVSIGKDASC